MRGQSHHLNATKEKAKEESKATSGDRSVVTMALRRPFPGYKQPITTLLDQQPAINADPVMSPPCVADAGGVTA